MEFWSWWYFENILIYDIHSKFLTKLKKDFYKNLYGKSFLIKKPISSNNDSNLIKGYYLLNEFKYNFKVNFSVVQEGSNKSKFKSGRLSYRFNKLYFFYWYSLYIDFFVFLIKKQRVFLKNLSFYNQGIFLHLSQVNNLTNSYDLMELNFDLFFLYKTISKNSKSPLKINCFFSNLIFKNNNVLSKKT